MGVKTRRIKIGDIYIGAGEPIAVQSMLSRPSYDVSGNVEQAVELSEAGCEILRVAIPDMDSVHLIDAIKSKIDIPLVADIHFDYKLALESVAAGVDKIRINPGNIGDEDRVKKVAAACGRRGIPIRIGVNTGSLEKSILAKYGSPCPSALVESAMYHVSLLEKFDFNNIVIAIKSSKTDMTIKAYELMDSKSDYPLHLGVTEAGTERMGIIKSAIAIGSLLQRGIGDTIRVSLTDEPVKEIAAANDILKALEMKKGLKITSCPSCGRTGIDLIKLTKQVEEELKGCDKDITVAVMGCIVNGPGEAREADIGIAGGKGEGLLFKKGKIIKKVPEKLLLKTLIDEINLY